MGDDLISRQAVLNILEREGHKWGNDYRDWVDAVNEVETLPSVNPQEPKTGGANSYKCPECGSHYTYQFAHCPTCGAIMTESEKNK